MGKHLRELEHEDMAERVALPSSVSKLLKGYELRVCWFEIFECVRKLAVACLPVFFQPSGSASQLLFGLMVCFVCFGAYVHFDPFEDRGNDAVARLCQVQIFFSLLSSVALSFSDDENAGSNIDVLLVVLLFLPVTLAVVLESPLKPAVSALMSRLATKQKKPPVRPESAETWAKGKEDKHNVPSNAEANSRQSSLPLRWLGRSSTGPSIARHGDVKLTTKLEPQAACVFFKPSQNTACGITLGARAHFAELTKSRNGLRGVSLEVGIVTKVQSQAARDGNIKVGDRIIAINGEVPSADEGPDIILSSITNGSTLQLKLLSEKAAVVVNAVEPNGIAATCGLKVGHEVILINGERVTSHQHGERLIKSAQGEVKISVAESTSWRDLDVPESPRGGSTNPRSLSIGQRSASDL